MFQATNQIQSPQPTDFPSKHQVVGRFFNQVARLASKQPAVLPLQPSTSPLPAMMLSWVAITPPALSAEFLELSLEATACEPPIKGFV
jgi:hypothetical protein